MGRSGLGAASHVTVRYDVTSLGPEGAAFVEELEAGYDGFLDEWRHDILAGLARERGDVLPGR